MKRAVRCSTIWKRRSHGPPRCGLATLLPVESAAPSAHGYPDIQAFQQRAVAPKKPLLFRRDAGSPTAQLPALKKWFGEEPSAQRSLSAYIAGFEDWPFPYELVQSESEKQDAVANFRDWLMASSVMADQIMAGILQAAVTEGEQDFFQLYGPLKLLIKALEFNKTQDPKASSTLELYIAQSSLSDLPQPLQGDLPTPELVQRAGKGDVYSSSIWLGTEPTYTPLHRDPNPNLFCQLCSRKVVRLLPPLLGDRLFFEVQVKLRKQGNSRIRTTEMMEGEEREVLHDAVWGKEALPDQLQQVELSPGDALFIPDGWWHSVKSSEIDGRLNGSKSIHLGEAGSDTASVQSSRILSRPADDPIEAPPRPEVHLVAALHLPPGRVCATASQQCVDLFRGPYPQGRNDAVKNHYKRKKEREEEHCRRFPPPSKERRAEYGANAQHQYGEATW
ncbi:putative lysine-specific demethylase JMJD5 [Tolypocladium ophioglossoides CBS 100239]|uniref:Putative lysine-specific demethylase JMJD5 n=1 Tax=Tolypocladium ophioglossoides (strain CBS 100239) TaxID=1163406 RepID=A0A0L0N8Z7_TOLOC|nr:putative lysine-specific demethylase JMJD5 [Tolypocladium ophioglossoides CBS 100239]